MFLSDFFQSMIVFAFGGLLGSLAMWSALLDEVFDSMPGMPWRARSVIYRFWGFARLARSASDMDRAYRESYAYMLVGTMADLGGPTPIPRTRSAMEALLKVTERRFQVMLKERGLSP